MTRNRMTPPAPPTAESDAIVEIALDDPDATQALAGRLAHVAHAGDVIGLGGALGAGKTTFARGFIRECARIDGQAPEDVPSPTFTLVQTYEFAAAPVYHFDLYRIDDPDEVLELGIEDAFADGISLIEWPERLGPYLPAERLDVELTAGATAQARRALLTGHGGWAARVGALVQNV